MEEPRTYLIDSWYAAATSEEVGEQPLSRRICGEQILLVRLSNGEARAFIDRCPHRKLPLSMGSFRNDEIECAYHGLRFNGEGRCVFIPAQDNIPKFGFDVPRFEVVERYGLVHVWIGDPRQADPALVPAYPFLEEPGWVAVSGYSYVKANYLLLIDNLHDLSHLAYVHRSTFGGVNLNETPLKLTVDGDLVKTYRWMPQTAQTQFIRKARRFTHSDPIDRDQSSDFLLPSSVIVSLGAGERGGEVSPHHVVYNSITPETEGSAHYFWFVVRRDSPDDAEVSRFFHDMTRDAFLEDRLTIEAQQRAIDEDPTNEPLRAVAADRATLAVRRVIARKVAEQRASEAISVQTPLSAVGE